MADRFFKLPELTTVGNPKVNIGDVAKVVTPRGNPAGAPRPYRQRQRGRGAQNCPSTDSSASNNPSLSPSSKATTPEREPTNWSTPDPWVQPTKKQTMPLKVLAPVAKPTSSGRMTQPKGQGNAPKDIPILDHLGRDVRFRTEGPPRTKEQLAHLKALCDSTWDAIDDNGNKIKDVDLTNIHHLADWDGNLAPPPVDWDCRSGFRPFQSEVIIQAYVNSTADYTPEILEHFQEMIKSDLEGKSDLAIPTWQPLIPGVWQDCLEFCKSMSTTEDEWTPIVPFWKHFRTGWDHLMKPLEQPHIAGIGPDESDIERKARENDRGSQGRIEDMLRDESERQVAEQKRKVEKQQERERNRIAAAEAAAAAPPAASFDDFFKTPNNQIKTGCKIFLRAARDADIPEIRDIYNHYVTNTVAVPETDDLTSPQMMKRMHDIKEANFPFIVACEKGSVLRGNKKHPRDPVVLPDRILGFAFASPSAATFPNTHRQPAYNPRTAYLNIFTKPTHSMNGIASCLLDKLLDVLDKFCFPRGGYNVKGDEVNGIGVKIQRVKDLEIRFLFADGRRLPWITRWLQSEYVGFRKVEEVVGVGVKNGLSVNEAIFHYETGEQFSPLW